MRCRGSERTRIWLTYLSWAQVRAARRLLGKLVATSFRHAAAAATVDEYFRHAQHGRYAHGHGEMHVSFELIFSSPRIGSV